MQMVRFSVPDSYREDVTLRSDSDNRQLAEAGIQFFIRGNVVSHFSIVELLIGHHIKISRSRQTKHNGLFFTGFLALQSLINGNLDGMGTLRSGEDTFNSGKILRGFKNLRLFHRYRFHQPVVV